MAAGVALMYGDYLAAGEYAIGALPVVGNAMDVIATVRKSSNLARWACTFTKVGHFGVMTYAGVTAWQSNDFFSMALMLVSGLRGLRAACFTEGTQVITGFDETGQAITKNIEDLRKGDLVVSRDEHDPNAELELREVQQVFVRRVYELQVISIEDNETGETQQINTTGEHPFWVDGQGWTRADELQLGDQVQNPDGTWATLTSNVVQVHAGGTTVYNLEVQNEHTFFVSGSTNGINVWVHNSKCAGLHHLVPVSMGSKVRRGSPMLTYVGNMAHTHMHKKLSQFLRQKRRYSATLGRWVDMDARKGNSGKVVRIVFSKQERIRALREFYAQYTFGGRSFLSEFRQEMKQTLMRGLFE